MSPYMHTSSPLSQVESIATPPGAGVNDPPTLVPASSPATASEPVCVSDIDRLQDGARAQSPIGSADPSITTGSRKRAHAQVERPPTTMAPSKRVKKATPKPGPKAAPKGTPKPSQKAAQKATPKAAAPAPPVGTRSSGRARKAPERFATLASPPRSIAAPPRKAASKVFEPIFITTNANSRLKKTDLFHMLLEVNAWTCLTPYQKLKILALLPENPINIKLAQELRAGTAAEDARPREVSLNFDLFRTDVAKFKEDLENGHLGKTWQASAEQAVVDRAAGAFDDWKEYEAELWWGQN